MTSPQGAAAPPADAAARRAVRPVACYPAENLPAGDWALYAWHAKSSQGHACPICARWRRSPVTTLDWYRFDQFGGSVHDVIGTRCDPYAHRLLSERHSHHCCHSNLTRALAAQTGLSLAEAEAHVHDVLNVFMCAGFTLDGGRYFMKASPVRVDHVPVQVFLDPPYDAKGERMRS